jgi:hypothetical protein
MKLKARIRKSNLGWWVDFGIEGFEGRLLPNTFDYFKYRHEAQDTADRLAKKLGVELEWEEMR